MYTFIPYTEADYITATSYITVDELKSIVSGNIFIDYTDVETDPVEDIENILINATSLIDMLFTYAGERQLLDQRLEFPRDFEEDFIINEEIKLATAYISGEIKAGNASSFVESSDGKYIRREKADVLEIEYAEFGSVKDAVLVNNPYLEKLLSGYIGHFMTIPVVRTL